MRAPQEEGGYFYGTPQALAAALAVVVERTPTARLVKNQVGNLSILDEDGTYIGYVDLHEGETWYRGDPA